MSVTNITDALSRIKDADSPLSVHLTKNSHTSGTVDVCFSNTIRSSMSDKYSPATFVGSFSRENSIESVKAAIPRAIKYSPYRNAGYVE